MCAVPFSIKILVFYFFREPGSNSYGILQVGSDLTGSQSIRKLWFWIFVRFFKTLENSQKFSKKDKIYYLHGVGFLV